MGIISFTVVLILKYRLHYVPEQSNFAKTQNSHRVLQDDSCYIIETQWKSNCVHKKNDFVFYFHGSVSKYMRP